MEHLVGRKKNFLNSYLRLSSMVKKSVIFSDIQSLNKAKQKLGLLKTLPSAKIKQLIIDKNIKNY